MDLTFGQELNTEQTQQLSLTPEMVQSLKILRLGGEDLLEYIFDAVAENPVLDVNEDDLADRQVVAASDVTPDDTEDAYGDKYDGGMEEDEIEEPDQDIGWQTYYDGEPAVYGGFSYDSEYRDQYEFAADSYESLAEHLGSQLDMTEAPFLVKAVADYIIQTLDKNGYMTLTLSDIQGELNVDRKTAEDALSIVQSFDPVGVGASSLSECLEMQLRDIDKWDSVYETILERHTRDIADNRLGRIARDMGLRLSDVQERADVLRSLEPKPGNGFSGSGSVRYIIPDVKVKKIEGKYHVYINRASSPRLMIRDEYLEMMEQTGDADVKDFLSEHMSSASWLIKALKQRSATMMKVTMEVVRRQRAFFDEGRGALRALTMKDVAEAIGVHESTVSRAVNDKYLLCSQGVFSMKYFFTGAVSYGSSGASAESVKVLISKMVNAENRAEPMSDRSIAEAIHITGVRISRRTVAKYREELGIPSSSVRRRAR